MLLRSTILLIILLRCIPESNAQQRQIDSVQSVLRTLTNDSAKVDCYLTLCLLERERSNERVLEFAQKALSLSNAIGYKKGLVKAYGIIAYINHRKGNLTEASTNQLKARDLYIALKDTAGLAIASNNIGILYMSSGQLEESLPYFKEAYFLSAVISDQNRVLGFLYNLGCAYRRLNKDSVSLSYLNKALRLSNEINDKTMRSSVLSEIGRIYYNLGNLTEAMKYLTQAKEAENGLYPPARYEIPLNLAQVYCATRQYKLAIESGEGALPLAKKVDDRFAISDCYERLSVAYAGVKNFEKAFHYHVLFKQVQDSLKSARNALALKKLNNRLELEKKEAEMNILKQQLAADVFKRNTFITAFLAVLIAAVLLYRRYRTKTKATALQGVQHHDAPSPATPEPIHKIDELEFVRNSLPTDSDSTKKLNTTLQHNILTELGWKNFRDAFEEIHPTFFAQLRHHFPTLSMDELRLSALIKLNLSLKDMAIILHMSQEGVKAERYKLRKKYSLKENDGLEEFIEKATAAEEV